jgi:predicted ferric reductase
VKGEPTFWLLTRASGMTAYLLLTSAAIAGLTVKSRALGRSVRPASVVDVHRFLSALALGFLALHGCTLVFDRAVSIPVTALFVPGVSPYRPLWTGLGVIAGEIAAIVVISFRVRRLIGARAWRLLHWTTYAAFAAATAHGVAAGSDTRHAWALGAYLGAVGAVAGATAWRALVPRGRPARPARHTDLQEGART